MRCLTVTNTFFYAYIFIHSIMNSNNAINNALMPLLNYKNLVMPIFSHFFIKLKSFFFRTLNAIFSHRLANNNYPP
jgi:hypothetical protein